MKEYVMCSAIHYDDGRKYPHQPVNIQGGFVIAGRKHKNCKITLEILSTKNTFFGKSSGFLTNTNRFIDRWEALFIAKEAKQLLRTELKHPDEGLHSGDIFP